MQQRSLFPDHFELQELALAELQQLRPAAALAAVERASRLDGRLGPLAPLRLAIDWLCQRIEEGAAPPPVAMLVLWWHEVAAEQVAGTLSAAVGSTIERVLARRLLAAAPATPLFVDAGQTVPISLLRLCSGGSVRTGDRAALADLLATPEGAERADHWATYGDLCWLAERPAEAATAYARAFLLAPAEVSLWHLQQAALRELLLQQRQQLGATACLRYFTLGLLAGLLQVPVRSQWLNDEQWELLWEHCGDPWHRFGLLLYRDQSLGERGDKVDRRLQLHELLPDAFAGYMALLAAREGTLGGAP